MYNLIMELNKDKFIISKPLEALIIQLLKHKQRDLCSCGITLQSGFQLHHKHYANNITLENVELLCGRCHALKHGVRSARGRVRR